MRLLILLFFCWYAFSGLNDWFYLTSGVASVIITYFICVKLNILNKDQINRYLSLAFIGYCFFLAKQIILSTFKTSKALLFNKKFDPKFVKIKLDDDMGENFLYASSITLTPGTVSAQMTETELYVLALSADDRETLTTEDPMFNRIKNFD